MHGLVSLLPSPYYEEVELLWEMLGEDFDLQGIRVTPYPHFSWQIAQAYDFEKLESAVREVARQTKPFKVRTTGIGLFTGSRPVIFIPVVKDEQLVRFHAQIWERVLPASTGHSPYYQPKSWVPHISLAYEDVRPDNIGGIMHRLAFNEYNWEVEIDNISLIYEPDGEIGALKFRHPFLG